MQTGVIVVALVVELVRFGRRGTVRPEPTPRLRGESVSLIKEPLQ